MWKTLCAEWGRAPSPYNSLKIQIPKSIYDIKIYWNKIISHNSIWPRSFSEQQTVKSYIVNFDKFIWTHTKWSGQVLKEEDIYYRKNISKNVIKKNISENRLWSNFQTQNLKMQQTYREAHYCSIWPEWCCHVAKSHPLKAKTNSKPQSHEPMTKHLTTFIQELIKKKTTTVAMASGIYHFL